MQELIVETAPKGHRDPARRHIHDAMRDLIGKDVEAMAARLGLSASTLEKWRLPCEGWADTGIRGPAHRLDLLMDEADELGRDPHDVMGVVEVLAEKRGWGLTARGGLDFSDPLVAAGDLAEAGGAFVGAFLDAIADGFLTVQERQQLAPLMRRLKRAALRPEMIARLEVAQT